MRDFDHKGPCTHCHQWKALHDECEQCLTCCDCPPAWTRGKSVMGKGNVNYPCCGGAGEDQYPFGFDYGQPFPEELR